MLELQLIILLYNSCLHSVSKYHAIWRGVQNEIIRSRNERKVKRILSECFFSGCYFRCSHCSSLQMTRCRPPLRVKRGKQERTRGWCRLSIAQRCVLCEVIIYATFWFYHIDWERRLNYAVFSYYIPNLRLVPISDGTNQAIWICSKKFHQKAATYTCRPIDYKMRLLRLGV